MSTVAHMQSTATYPTNKTLRYMSILTTRTHIVLQKMSELDVHHARPTESCGKGIYRLDNIWYPIPLPKIQAIKNYICLSIKPTHHNAKKTQYTQVQTDSNSGFTGQMQK